MKKNSRFSLRGGIFWVYNKYNRDNIGEWRVGETGCRGADDCGDGMLRCAGSEAVGWKPQALSQRPKPQPLGQASIAQMFWFINRNGYNVKALTEAVPNPISAWKLQFPKTWRHLRRVDILIPSPCVRPNPVVYSTHGCPL